MAPDSQPFSQLVFGVLLGLRGLLLAPGLYRGSDSPPPSIAHRVGLRPGLRSQNRHHGPMRGNRSRSDLRALAGDFGPWSDSKKTCPQAIFRVVGLDTWSDPTMMRAWTRVTTTTPTIESPALARDHLTRVPPRRPGDFHGRTET